MSASHLFDHMNALTGLLVASLMLAAFSLGMYFRERQRSLSLAVELDKVSRQMTAQLERDKLTGLLTRSSFVAVLDKRAQKVDSSSEAFCVLYVALDNFGMLNDAFGHSIGDRLLHDVAQRLAECADSKTEVCRITAGEFAFIVNGGMAIGRSTANRVAEVLGEPFKFDSIQTQLSCSIGIAAHPEHGSRSKLLGHAALAMRSVMLNGGGRLLPIRSKNGD